MEFFELQVKLYHHNCWTAELSKMFPCGEILYPISRTHTIKGTLTYVMTKASLAEIKNLIRTEKFLQFNPRIVGTINASKRSQISIISFLFNHHNSVYNLTGDLNGAMSTRVSYFEDCEIWNFLVPSRGSREKEYDIRERIESVANVEQIKKLNQPELMKENIDDYLRFYLSESNYSLIRKLVEIGYFDFPRRVSIDDASKILRVSKGFISKISRRVFDIFHVSK